MEWKRIRAHYERAFVAAKSRGVTQSRIAVQGGLKGQNVISKLLANDSKGPQVETFVNAVLGLGIPLSVFFAELEAAERAAQPERAAEPRPEVLRAADERQWVQVGRVIGRAIARELAALDLAAQTRRTTESDALKVPASAGRTRRRI